MYKNAATFDTLRSIAYGSITSSYVQLGSVLPSTCVCVCFTNYTNGVIYVSTDAINDMIAVPPNTAKVFDIRTNAPNWTDYLLSQGTPFYIKYSVSPTQGDFYIEAVITQGQT